MIALRYLASNSHQQTIADSFDVSQKAVSTSVNEVIDLLSEKVPSFVSFPTDVNVTRAMQAEFYELGHFPRVIGAIDCTHIRIRDPPSADSIAYVNRKGYHSMNVQAICDANGKYTNVVARWCGSTHDSFILRNSELWHAIEGKNLCPEYLPTGAVILGDSGYPCRPWLLTPVANPETHAEMQFNIAHRRTRIVVEQSFGRLKRQWNILHEGLRVPVATAPKLISVCFMLRNIAIDRNLLEDNENEIAGDDDNLGDDNAAVTRTGGDRRQEFITRYFR